MKKKGNDHLRGMKVSVEVSKYPLSDTYIPKVLAFIDCLNGHPEVEVLTNALSTHLHGDLDVIMGLLTEATRASFGEGVAGAVIIKVLPGDARLLG